MESHSKLVNIINEATNQAYKFNLWEYRNEAEFKFELFHILANKKLNGTLLNEKINNTPTSFLHCEAKPQVGLRQLVDLLFCNPEGSNHPIFNYNVTDIIELKYNMNKADLKKEIAKLDNYNRKFDSVFLISATGFNFLNKGEILHRVSEKVFLKFPDNIGKEMTFENQNDEIDPQTVYNIIIESIIITLLKYGNNRKQYKSFFWCNYEAETNRGHSFPCEGDFNAYLYNEMRLKLPKGVIIRSEFPIKSPDKSNFRTDFVVTDVHNSFMIPIETKMNWDQFKLIPQQPISEANKIIKRFELIKRTSNFKFYKPILIVIQGDWRIYTTIKKEESLKDLQKALIPYLLFWYSENSDRIERYEHKVTRNNLIKN